MSTLGQVTSGVPQGSVVGPTLFLVYINDLGQNLKSKVRLFADDTVLYNFITDQSSSAVLQQDLRALERWEETWQMEFNVTKCHVMSITNKRKPAPPSYTLHGHTMKQVSSAAYLGVELTDKLHWGKHVHAVAAKANRTSAFIYRNLKGCPTRVQTHCYKGLVRPVLEYAAPVWDPYQQSLCDTLEAVQRRSVRRILHNFDPRVSASDMVQKLGLQTLRERRMIDRAAMLYKIHGGLVDIPAKTFLTPVARSMRGQTEKLLVPQSRTNAHLHSFFPSAIRLWNSLPQEAVAASSLPAFKSALRGWAHNA